MTGAPIQGTSGSFFGKVLHFYRANKAFHPKPRDLDKARCRVCGVGAWNARFQVWALGRVRTPNPPVRLDAPLHQGAFAGVLHQQQGPCKPY